MYLNPHIGRKFIMIKIIGRYRLKEYWKKHPKTEQPLKAWFYREQRFSYRNVDKVIENFPKAKLFTFQITPSTFLLAKLRTDLEVMKILAIGTLYKAGDHSFSTH
jgi:mRNA interferase HigB